MIEQAYTAKTYVLNQNRSAVLIQICLHSDTDAQTYSATEHMGNDLIQNVRMLLIQNVTRPVSDM